MPDQARDGEPAHQRPQCQRRDMEADGREDRRGPGLHPRGLRGRVLLRLLSGRVHARVPGAGHREVHRVLDRAPGASGTAARPVEWAVHGGRPRPVVHEGPAVRPLLAGERGHHDQQRALVPHGGPPGAGGGVGEAEGGRPRAGRHPHGALQDGSHVRGCHPRRTQRPHREHGRAGRRRAAARHRAQLHQARRSSAAEDRGQGGSLQPGVPSLHADEVVESALPAGGPGRVHGHQFHRYRDWT
mmetsp:Transcript_18832/g.49932  ORF Transcript_18832/g.49932 Transcript_18832/m.49932 type:complete len:243 (+) Transcript_18832:180-908(+)